MVHFIEMFGYVIIWTTIGTLVGSNLIIINIKYYYLPLIVIFEIERSVYT